MRTRLPIAALALIASLVPASPAGAGSASLCSFDMGTSTENVHELGAGLHVRNAGRSLEGPRSSRPSFVDDDLLV
jgi:hypothetical protein